MQLPLLEQPFFPFIWTAPFPPSKYKSEYAFSSSFDGRDEEGALELPDDATSDGHMASIRVNGGDGIPKDVKIVSRQMPIWLSNSTPDEFLVRTISELHLLLSYVFELSSFRLKFWVL